MMRVTFSTVDYIVMFIFIAISSGIGIFYGVIKGQKTTDEYLYGNRRMHLLPVAVSLLVTFQSATSCLGIPADAYTYNSMIAYGSLGAMLAMLLSSVTIVPLLYPLKLNSAYEYLGRRFNSRSVQLLGTCIGMLQTLLYMSVVLFSPALAIEAVAGIPLWLSVMTVGLVGTIYTSLGGFKSVIWTDVFQFIVMYAGLVTILILAGTQIGSLGKILDIARDGGRLDFKRDMAVYFAMYQKQIEGLLQNYCISFTIVKEMQQFWTKPLKRIRNLLARHSFCLHQAAHASFDPRVRHSLWSCMLGGMFTWLPNCCNQSAVQRMCSMRSLRDAKLAMVINAPFTFIFDGILTLTGLILYAYFVIKQCDPVQAGYIDNANQLMPYFVILILTGVPALAGLFIATLLSGALSSLSSGINALATNTIQDLFVNHFAKMTQTKKTFIAKIIVFGYGAFAVAIAYSMKSLSGPVTQISSTAFGACGGPYVGMFFLGAIFPQANWIGALTGGIVGIVFNVWLAVSSVVHAHPSQKSPLIPSNACIDQSSNSSLTDLPYNNGSHIYYGSTVNSSLYTSPSPTDSSLFGDDSGHMHLYDISYFYLGITGFLVSLITGMIVSLCSGKDRQSQTDPIYIFPFLRRFWNYRYTSNRTSYVLSKRRRSSRITSVVADSEHEQSPIKALEFTTITANTTTNDEEDDTDPEETFSFIHIHSQ